MGPMGSDLGDWGGGERGGITIAKYSNNHLNHSKERQALARGGGGVGEEVKLFALIPSGN